jgi:hypothetical protein
MVQSGGVRRLELLSAIAVIAVWARAADPGEFFEARVRPILAKNCHGCHTEARMRRLRLDSAESVRKGGNSAPTILLGNPEGSLLIQAVQRTHACIKMPPSGKLPDADIEALTKWVKTGCGSHPGQTSEQRAFWAFQQVRKPPVPPVRNAAWPRGPIDQFVLAALEKPALKPAPSADKRVLIRGAAFDLIGLPRTPEEVDAFLAHRSPDAFAKVVDRVLSSPHYGERWGPYWLDVARYSDDKLNSIQEELHRNGFRYRDWGAPMPKARGSSPWIKITWSNSIASCKFAKRYFIGLRNESGF